MYEFTPLFPGMPGGIEIFVVLIVVVLLFGANKLPKLARSSGQAMGEFKKGREQVETELREMQQSGAAAEPDAAGRDAEAVRDPDSDADTEADPDLERASAD